MVEKIRALCLKYKGLLLYVIFGGMTTVINIAVYMLLYSWLGWNNDLSNIIAWILSVLFAFLTNKPFVFESHDWSLPVLLREGRDFFLCRLATGLMDLVIMHIFVTMLGLPGGIMKLISNVLVIILNYVGSKLVVFRKGKKKEEN